MEMHLFFERDGLVSAGVLRVEYCGSESAKQREHTRTF